MNAGDGVTGYSGFASLHVSSANGFCLLSAAKTIPYIAGTVKTFLASFSIRSRRCAYTESVCPSSAVVQVSRAQALHTN
jgi:hypothetical protein